MLRTNSLTELHVHHLAATVGDEGRVLEEVLKLRIELGLQFPGPPVVSEVTVQSAGDVPSPEAVYVVTLHERIHVLDQLERSLQLYIRPFWGGNGFLRNDLYRVVPKVVFTLRFLKLVRGLC